MKIFDYINFKYIEWFGLHEGLPFIETRPKAFFDGREFRTFFDINLATGNYAVIRFYSPVDFFLKIQSFQVNEGELKFEALLGGSEGGVFTPISTFGTNRSSFRPFPLYIQQAVLSSGGTHTGGTNSELVRIKSGGNSVQRSTVGTEFNTERFLPAGTYYLKFTAVDTLKAVYSLRWEEHP